MTTTLSAQWRKSSASNIECVEVAYQEGMVLVRDSKSPSTARLQFTPAEWQAFVTGVKRGEFEVSSR